MSEALFILTVIFVAYVVNKTVNQQKETPESVEPKAQPAALKVVAEPSMPKVSVNNEKPAAVKKTTITATRNTGKKKGLRDPKTGEITTSHANYRFTKRWIKEALVAEGLLEKVYKNNELDAGIEAAIKTAMTQLEAMDKYRA
jgi:hypothetical protein